MDLARYMLILFIHHMTDLKKHRYVYVEVIALAVLRVTSQLLLANTVFCNALL